MVRHEYAAKPACHRKVAQFTGSSWKELELKNQRSFRSLA
jgi:hypothetical protein